MLLKTSYFILDFGLSLAEYLKALCSFWAALEPDSLESVAEPEGGGEAIALHLACRPQCWIRKIPRF